MSGWGLIAVEGVALVSAGVGAVFASQLLFERYEHEQRKRDTVRHQKEIVGSLLKAGDLSDNEETFSLEGQQVNGGVNYISTRVLSYAAYLSGRLTYRSTQAFSPCVRAGHAHKAKAAFYLEEHAVKAGYGKEITAEGFIEARFRLAVIAGITALLFGSLFSPEMAFVLALFAGLYAWLLPQSALIKREQLRANDAERNLSEMLEVVALGLRSGLNFDRSFQLYATHFYSSLAHDCRLAHQSWSMGFASREEALRRLADSYQCEGLARAIESSIRSMRFGTSFAADLEELAAQSRDSYRSAISERVAKAPIKMMLPTSALILPAMLLLVLGPILLELVQGF